MLLFLNPNLNRINTLLFAGSDNKTTSNFRLVCISPFSMTYGSFHNRVSTRTKKFVCCLQFFGEKKLQLFLTLYLMFSVSFVQYTTTLLDRQLKKHFRNLDIELYFTAQYFASCYRVSAREDLNTSEPRLKCPNKTLCWFYWPWHDCSWLEKSTFLLSMIPILNWSNHVPGFFRLKSILTVKMSSLRIRFTVARVLKSVPSHARTTFGLIWRLCSCNQAETE